MRPNPYTLSAADAYRADIEAASGCTISLAQLDDDDEACPRACTEWWGRATRDTCRETATGCGTATAASEFGTSKLDVLDKIAAALGVTDRINREAITAPAAAAAVNLRDGVMA